ncbi:MAG: MliC family protein [Betaproteobacteria bacterium]|nr:MliC family protein [Betaproteobacteria bacterium]
MKLSFVKPVIRVSPILCVVTALVLSGCDAYYQQKRDEEEAIKNTVDCTYQDERLLVRFDRARDEVRLLMPDGVRIYLYKMPSSRGVLYTNGDYELLGKGTDVTFGPVGNTSKLTCKPYKPEDGDKRKEDRKGLRENQAI